MKRLITLAFFVFLYASATAQTIIFQEKFDAMPSYVMVGWGYSFTGVVPWQCGIPFWVGPCMQPTGAAMSENSGTNKVACFTECSGLDHNDSNVFTNTPFINMTPVSGAWLKYDSYYGAFTYSGDTERATVEISTDSGATWTVLEHVGPSMPQGLFQTHYIDLAAYSHAGNIKIGFRYSDGGGFLMNGWAIDNVTVFIPAHKDISIVSVTPSDTLLSYIPLNSSYTHRARIYNAGIDTIRDFTLNYRQDAGAVKTINITGLTIPPFTTGEYIHNIADTVFALGKHKVKIWATLDSDSFHSNDSGTAYISGVNFLPSKKLTIESGEGTYNGWSPRNIYYLRMVPVLDIQACLISIHEFDPMVDTPYHDYMFNLGWNYVPYILFDRRKSIPLDSFFYYIDVQKRYFGFADIQLSSSTSGSDINVHAAITPALNMTGDFRLALILTEDGVTGTTIDYDQANNYAFNAHGPMGGFETMANPIPAANMVYNYVARQAFPSPDGQPGVLPGTLNAGETYNYTFTTTLDPAWNARKVRAKVLLIRHNDSTVLNANEIPFPVAVTDPGTPFGTAAVYPNPAQEGTTLYFDIEETASLHITLCDLSGRTLYICPETTFTAGPHQLTLPVNQLSSGMYIVNLAGETGHRSLKLQVIH